MGTAVSRDDFNYGWNPNPTGAAGGGGLGGSQPGSQADGQGAGITPIGFNDQRTLDPGAGSTPTSPWGGTAAGPGASGGGQEVQGPAPSADAGPPPAAPGGSEPAAPMPDFSSLLNQVHAAATPQEQAQSQDKLARTLYQSLTAAGHKVSWGDHGELMVDGRPYTVAGANPAAPSFGQAVSDVGGLGQLPADLSAWRPSMSSLYTPGQIGTGDIPNFTYSDLMQQMQNGALGGANRDLITQIQQNPSTLSPQVVDTMKAQMKDTLAAQQQQQEEDLKGFGAASGISDSGWLAAQRGASRRARDIGIAQGNQNLDIQAAKQQQADRLAAGSLGLQAGSENRGNVQAAASASLQRAAETGNRMQLQESVKQAAGQLGLSQQQVMVNFIQQKEQNLLQKYGIDLGARIDLARLGEQSSEFQQDLLFKMSALDKQLGQSASQFGQQLGYQYDVLDTHKDDQNWQRLLDITGAQKPTSNG